MAKLSKPSVALIALLATGIISARAQTEISLPGSKLFTESITSTKDGAIYLGSVGHGTVSRIPAGSTTAAEWIKPDQTNGLKQVFGVYADEPHATLWVCNSAPGPNGAALKTFNLKTGAYKASYTLAGDKAFCNDIAVATNGNAYISDTGTAKVLLLRPGSTTLEEASSDPLLKGVDGIAFSQGALYTNSYDNGDMQRLDLGPDGKATKVTELKLTRKLDRPDGLRSLGNNRFLQAENSGDVTLVTITGDSARIDNINSAIKPSIKGTVPAVTYARGKAWFAEGKLEYMEDPKLKDQSPDPFKLYAVEIPR